MSAECSELKQLSLKLRLYKQFECPGNRVQFVCVEYET